MGGIMNLLLLLGSRVNIRRARIWGGSCGTGRRGNWRGIRCECFVRIAFVEKYMWVYIRYVLLGDGEGKGMRSV